MRGFDPAELRKAGVNIRPNALPSASADYVRREGLVDTSSQSALLASLVGAPTANASSLPFTSSKTDTTGALWEGRDSVSVEGGAPRWAPCTSTSNVRRGRR